LSRHCLACIFFSHKASKLQLVKAFSGDRNRQNNYITEYG
jgi:hypothetical protein